MTAGVPVRRVLYLHRPDIVAEHREVVEDFFRRVLPGVAVAVESEPEGAALEAEALIAPAAGWIAPVTARMPRLAWIHFVAAGVDGARDLLAARPDLLASRSAGVNAAAMAEFAFAAILHLGKRLGHFADRQRAREWDRVWLPELAGRRLLLLGAGDVAQAIGRRAAAFDMPVTAIARTPGPRPDLPLVLPAEALGEALPAADILVVCLPLTAATAGLLGADRLRLLPPQAILIDIARGGIVDEPALAAMLREGRLAGALLDVFAEEPLPADSPLWSVPNLLVTPHVAGTTDRYVPRLLEIFRRNLGSLAETGRLATPIDRAAGY